MGLPIPMEIITMAGGSLLGGLMKLWGMKQDIQIRQQEMMGQILGKVQEGREAIRQNTNPHFQWTRRVIALTCVFAVILLPKLVTIFSPETLVTIGWTEWNPGFLFFSGSEETRWHTVQGLTLTPLDTHTLSLIIGLYFGGSLVGHR